MRKKEKPDIKKAQRIARQAFMRIARDCGIRYSPETFLVVILSATSAVTAEVVSSHRLMEGGGIEDICKFGAETFDKMLRKDLGGRLEHERKQARH